jgi:hypothetical protein
MSYASAASSCVPESPNPPISLMKSHEKLVDLC